MEHSVTRLRTGELELGVVKVDTDFYRGENGLWATESPESNAGPQYLLKGYISADGKEYGANELHAGQYLQNGDTIYPIFALGTTQITWAKPLVDLVELPLQRPSKRIGRKPTIAAILVALVAVVSITVGLTRFYGDSDRIPRKLEACGLEGPWTPRENISSMYDISLSKVKPGQLEWLTDCVASAIGTSNGAVDFLGDADLKISIPYNDGWRLFIDFEYGRLGAIKVE
ncbi:MAG: hypothetical protein FWG25_10155 [Promicromonosporaceae bacterium]|nr:hypothetical protein [Promicromonosporaceae bacterium]